jgi:dihydroxyacetone kinase
MSQLIASPPADIISLLSSITFVVEKTMDGTSGALYAIFLNSLTHYFVSRAGEATVVDSKFWSEALDAALNSLKKYTAADVGDRTLMDALIPFVVTLRLGSLQEASAAAAEGAMNTMFMQPGLGRTVYIGDEDSWLGTIPDPGAWGLHRLLQGFAQ